MFAIECIIEWWHLDDESSWMRDHGDTICNRVRECVIAIECVIEFKGTCVFKCSSRSSVLVFKRTPERKGAPVRDDIEMMRVRGWEFWVMKFVIEFVMSCIRRHSNATRVIEIEGLCIFKRTLEEKRPRLHAFPQKRPTLYAIPQKIWRAMTFIDEIFEVGIEIVTLTLFDDDESSWMRVWNSIWTELSSRWDVRSSEGVSEGVLWGGCG